MSRTKSYLFIKIRVGGGFDSQQKNLDMTTTTTTQISVITTVYRNGESISNYHKWATSLTWSKNRRKHFRVYVLQLIRGFPWPEMSSLNFNLNYCGRTFGDFRQRKAQYKLVKCTYFSKGPIWLWKPSIHQNDPP